MRKTLLVTLDFPPATGGVANYYAHLCQNLPPDRIIVLAPPQLNSWDFDKSQSYLILRRNLVSKFAWPHWWPLISIIRRVVKQHKIEAVVAGQILPVGTACQCARKKLPMYHFCHGFDIASLTGRKKILARSILSRATGIISNSHSTLNRAVAGFGLTNTQTLVLHPAPHLTPALALASSEALRIHFRVSDKIVLLTLGRLVERKGHDAIISALSTLTRRFPYLLYIIAGQGPAEVSLKKLVEKLNLGNYVRFESAVDDQTAANLLILCDILVMTPKELPNGDHEGFGMVYLEANLFGKPVVATKTGGVPEAVIDGLSGLLIPPADQGALEAALTTLILDSGLRARLGLSGLDRVEREFQWPRQAKRFNDFIS